MAVSAKCKHFLKAAYLTSLMKSRKRVKNSLIQSQLDGSLTRSESLQIDDRKSWKMMVFIFVVFVITCFQPDAELSEFFTKIWELDNKCNPGQDFGIDLQGYAGYQSRDFAKNNLFEWFNEEEIFSRPTYAAFRALLDNYEIELGEAEFYTFEEKQETIHFIDTIMTTEVMKETHKFLVEHGKAPEDEIEFKTNILRLWFKLVRRTKGDSDQDSSSFEHVFVGETRQEGMIGLHNWLQYYLQEKAGNIDYQGYKRRCTVLDDEVDRIICTKFLWRGRKGKAACSMFLGSSPEFDIAVFTTCFLMGKIGHCDYQIGEYEVEVVVFPFGCVIGTAYIVPARMDEDNTKKC